MAKTPTPVPAEATKPPAPPHTAYVDPKTYIQPQLVPTNLEERKRLFELFVAMYPMNQTLDIRAINNRVDKILEEYAKWK